MLNMYIDFIFSMLTMLCYIAIMHLMLNTWSFSLCPQTAAATYRCTLTGTLLLLSVYHDGCSNVNSNLYYVSICLILYCKLKLYIILITRNIITPV